MKILNLNIIQSSEYYNDICYIYMTENGIDITLTDRKNEYNENNMSLCEVNCEYDGYNSNTKKAKCECQVKSKLSLISEIGVDKDEFLNNFINIKNTTNIKIIKCFKELFSKYGLKKNIGNYILVSLIIGNIICLVFFILKGYKLLNNIIYEHILNNKLFNNTNVNKKEKIYTFKR